MSARILYGEGSPINVMYPSTMARKPHGHCPLAHVLPTANLDAGPGRVSCETCLRAISRRLWQDKQKNESVKASRNACSGQCRARDSLQERHFYAPLVRLVALGDSPLSDRLIVRERGLQDAYLPMRVHLAGIARRAMIGAGAFPSNGRFTLLQLLCHDRRLIGLFSILVWVSPQRFGAYRLLAR